MTVVTTIRQWYFLWLVRYHPGLIDQGEAGTSPRFAPVLPFGIVGTGHTILQASTMVLLVLLLLS